MSSGAEILVFPLGLAAIGAAGAAVAMVGAARLAGGVADAVAAGQQRRIEVRARLERAGIDYAALRDRVNSARSRYGPAITPLPELTGRLRAGDHAAADQVLAELARAHQDAEQRLRAELASAGTAALVASMMATVREWTLPPGGPAAPQRRGRPGGMPSTPSGPTREVVETVERVLARLDTAVPEPVRAGLASRAAQLLAAPPGQVLMLVDDVRVGVQRANEVLAGRRARLADLHERLDRYTGAAVAAVRELLYRAADEPEPDWPGLAAAVDRAIDSTVAAALRDYTARALRESLEEIGCEVEEGFDVLLVRDGVAHLRRPGWDGLAVRVRQVGEESALRFNVIAAADAADEVDEDAEQGWCAEFDRLLPVLGGRGVPLQVRERSEIGAGYVQPVDPARFPFPRAERPPDRRRDVDRRQARQARPR